jgi:hypothetical protein
MTFRLSGTTLALFTRILIEGEVQDALDADLAVR